MMSRRLHGREIAAHVNDAKGSATSKSLHTIDTMPIMTVRTIAGCIEGLLDRREFKQTAYVLGRDSRKAASHTAPLKAEGEERLRA